MENNFEENIRNKLNQNSKSTNVQSIFINPWDEKNVVDDPNAPSFYSPLAIYLFSIIFSIIPGAILLSINVRSKRGKWLINLFGVAAFIFDAILVLGNNSRHPINFSLIVNGMSAVIMMSIFWNKYLLNIEYRIRRIWIPLLICLAIWIPLLALIIYANDSYV